MTAVGFTGRVRHAVHRSCRHDGAYATDRGESTRALPAVPLKYKGMGLPWES